MKKKMLGTEYVNFAYLEFQARLSRFEFRVAAQPEEAPRVTLSLVCEILVCDPERVAQPASRARREPHPQPAIPSV